jgi:hypothetical protein
VGRKARWSATPGIEPWRPASPAASRPEAAKGASRMTVGLVRHPEPSHVRWHQASAGRAQQSAWRVSIVTPGLVWRHQPGCGADAGTARQNTQVTARATVAAAPRCGGSTSAGATTDGRHGISGPDGGIEAGTVVSASIWTNGPGKLVGEDLAHGKSWIESKQCSGPC